MTYKTPRVVAVALVKPYVDRGDSIEEIMDGQMGMAGLGYGVTIGGCCDEKKLHKYQIAVTEFDGKECLEIFDFRIMYEELKMGVEKLELFN